MSAKITDHREDVFTPVVAGWLLFIFILVGTFGSLLTANSTDAEGGLGVAQFFAGCVSLLLCAVLIFIWRELYRIVALMQTKENPAHVPEVMREAKRQVCEIDQPPTMSQDRRAALEAKMRGAKIRGL